MAEGFCTLSAHLAKAPSHTCLAQPPNCFPSCLYPRFDSLGLASSQSKVVCEPELTRQQHTPPTPHHHLMTPRASIPSANHTHMLLWPGGLTMPVPYLASALMRLSCYLTHKGDHSFISQACVDQHFASCRSLGIDTTVMGEALTPLPVLRTKEPLEMPTPMGDNKCSSPARAHRGPEELSCSHARERVCTKRRRASSPHPESTSRILVNKTGAKHQGLPSKK